MHVSKGRPSLARPAMQQATASWAATLLQVVGVVLFLQLLSSSNSHCSEVEKSPILSMRIVNGDKVDIVDFPFQLSMENAFGHHQCGASIIGKEWAITAKHCFLPLEERLVKPNEYRLRAGSTQRQFGGSLHPVDRVIVYPNSTNFDYDVALLHVSAPFNYSQKVQKAELPNIDEPIKKKLQVTGYGQIGEFDTMATRLLKGDLTLWSREECTKFYKDEANFTITDRMICAGSDKQDACQGDSGGPLSVPGLKVVGVVSMGIGCGIPGHPGVYASLAQKEIRNFIKNHTNI